MDDSAPGTAAETPPSRPRLAPSTALLLAIWLGLCAGYLDNGVILVKKLAVNKERSYRNARDFPWTVPIGHVVLLAAPAAVLAIRSRRRQKWLSLRLGAWLLATLAFWFALLRAPLHPAAGLILAVGLGKVFSDVVAAYGFGAREWWVRTSLAGFVGGLVLLFAVTTGRQMLIESRAVAGLRASPSASPKNVVFIVWDTVRASNLSLYGYPRSTTPQLQRWAAKGVRFDWALASAPWTFPSHATFFTGLWPFQTNSQWEFTLRTPKPTLAEFLASRGYQTAGFAANTNSVNHETGLGRGFLHFDDYALNPSSLLTRTLPGKWMLEHILSVFNPNGRKWADLQSRGAVEINDAFLGWLDKRRADRPFFAFLNFFDAHEPYVPPWGYEGRFGIRPQAYRDYQLLVDYIGMGKSDLGPRDLTMIRDCYEDCIAFLDEQLGRLLDELERRRLLDDTVLVITSDHGEAFAEHGLCGHGYSTEIQEVGVPLVILGPGVPGGRVAPSAVSLRDLPATVAELLGFADDSPFPGRSLAEHWRVPRGQEPAHPTSPALAERATESTLNPSPDDDPALSGVEYSVVAPYGFQYVRTSQGDEYVFNLLADPHALINLTGTPDGDLMRPRLRKLLLEALTDNPGSVEAESAYLNAFRHELSEQTREHAAPKVSAAP